MTGNYRARWHDYTSRCIYLVTLNKRNGITSFGTIEGDCSIKVGEIGSPYVRYSLTGMAVRKAISEFPIVNPTIRILQYAIMPDHLHLLIFVENKTEEILGRIIARFKVIVNNNSGLENVFENGFNDQILKSSRKLDVIFNYIRSNPFRLAVRQRFPNYFSSINNLKIGERIYQAYGNMFLLRNPFKAQVVIHRKDDEESRKEKRELWLYTAANGGVLVSPFISPAEKAIRAEAESIGAKIILIVHEAFPERFKPPAHDFDLCADGRLLIITLGLPPKTPLTRNICLRMNTLAATLINL